MKKVCLISEYVPAIKKSFEQYGFDVLQRVNNAMPEDIDYAFSINFEPEVAQVCAERNIKYISWIVDCPHTVLYSKKVSNKNNYIFLFDYKMYCRMIQRETEARIFYLPLAAAYEEFEQVINSTKEIIAYQADVSFLGRLYSDPEHALYDQIKTFPDYVKGYLDSLMVIQHKMWGADLFRDTISENVWKQIDSAVKWDMGDEYRGHERETMINILNQKLAQIERMELCDRLSSKFNFCLYSQDDTSSMPNVSNRGYVDYMTEMPLVFAYSKINVNVTLRSIESGIPLRVLDILGCGGFLLTNYQEEIATYFQNGVDLVMYENFDDLEQKISYYLEHEEERLQIAKNGNMKVKELFGYAKQIGEMISMLEAE